MKALFFERYGSPDVLELKEVAKPSPKADEVLIRVRAASVNALDWRLVRADPFPARFFSGLLKPNFNIPGADVAGVVEAVGANVTAFRPGDEVFGDIFESGLGAFAEYVCAKESALVAKPAKVTFEEAAAVPTAAVTALQALRDKAGVRSGHKVLIHGAGGGVGTFLVQLARMLGAEVSAVCGTKNVELVRSLGAHRVIDYTKEDFARDGARYDVIVAANGRRSIFDYRRSLSANGVYVMVGGTGAQIFQGLLLGPLLSAFGDKLLRSLTLNKSIKKSDLVFLSELLESGQLKPVIDRRYPLQEAASAIGYVEGGHALGKVVVTVA